MNSRKLLMCVVLAVLSLAVSACIPSTSFWCDAPGDCDYSENLSSTTSRTRPPEKSIDLGEAMSCFEERGAEFGEISLDEDGRRQADFSWNGDELPGARCLNWRTGVATGWYDEDRTSGYLLECLPGEHEMWNAASHGYRCGP